MRILIDTQIVYWAHYEPEKLPPTARRYMDDAAAVYVSAASLWEIAIKGKLRKLKANPVELLAKMEIAGMRELLVFARHTLLVAELPLLHTDPFDRILIAQAISEPLRLLTSDSRIKQYSDLVIQV
jgi:PIN domain nuclease of toxin-antitoxin system